jgi:hypothetical protein
VQIEHYGPHGGQIRTNQFLTFPWLLREFRLQHRCRTVPCATSPASTCRLTVLPVPVKSTPFGALFHDDTALPQGPAFQQHFVNRVDTLLLDDVNAFFLDDNPRFNAGESENTPGLSNDYPFHFARGRGNFAQEIQHALQAQRHTLQPIHVVRRAMAMSCTGCHQLSNGSDLGNGIVWPSSAGFVHVTEDGTLSPALQDVFLPHRKMVLEHFLQGKTPLTVESHSSRFTPNVSMTIGGPRRTH